MADARQEMLDAFYWRHGPCCAGCDWWRHFNSQIGECRKSAPVAGKARWAMVSIGWSTLRPGAGHIVTPREHVCGEFADTFDWASLPLSYQRRVGAAGVGW